MNSIIKVMMNRDGMTKEEARSYVEKEMKVVLDYVGDGDADVAEDYFQDVFDLEPDYLLNAII